MVHTTFTSLYPGIVPGCHGINSHSVQSMVVEGSKLYLSVAENVWVRGEASLVLQEKLAAWKVKSAHHSKLLVNHRKSLVVNYSKS